VGAIQRFEREFLAFMRDSNASILDDIRNSKALGAETEKGLRAALEKFSKAFAA
jgi:F-type H+-transporting ATPase subunit alpha